MISLTFDIVLIPHSEVFLAPPPVLGEDQWRSAILSFPTVKLGDYGEADITNHQDNQNPDRVGFRGTPGYLPPVSLLSSCNVWLMTEDRRNIMIEPDINVMRMFRIGGLKIKRSHGIHGRANTMKSTTSLP